MLYLKADINCFVFCTCLKENGMIIFNSTQYLSVILDFTVILCVFD